MKNLSEILLNKQREKPDKSILILQLTGQEDQPITYRELVSGASSYSKAYARAGIHPGEVVILILKHGIDLVYAYWGAILHGAIPSIMPFLTEKLFPERYRADLISLIDITQPSAFITYREFIPEIKQAIQPGSSVRKIIVSDEVFFEEDKRFDFQGENQNPESIAILQHSSGTTGLQKGVALSHQAILNQLESYSSALKLNGDDVIVSWLPLYHDMGLIAGFIMPILMEVPLVLMSPFDWVKAPYRLMQAVSKYKGTLSWLPNFAFNFCAQKIRERHLEGVDLSTWRAINNCSEPTRYESHRMFYDRFKGYGLKPESLKTCYAMAENVFAVAQSGMGESVWVDEIDRDAFQIEGKAIPVSGEKPIIKMLSSGTNIKNTEIKVISGNKNELPDRTVGEIAIRSNCMLAEYYHRPDATEEAFQDGWYLTGDLGYKVGDHIFISGRKKDIIIVGGKNIYPQDIEDLAMTVKGVHPGRVSAFGVFNDENGTEEVVVIVEVDTDDQKARDEIAEEIQKTVTRGSAITLRDVYVTSPNWLVKTSSGKNARFYNREKYLAETMNF